MKRLSILLLAALLASCVVRYTYLAPGYGSQKTPPIKRLRLMVEPKAVIEPGLLPALLQMKREFLNVERQYVVLPGPSLTENRGGTETLCGLKPQADGILKTELRRLERQKDEVLVHMRLVLLDCDGNRMWDAYGEGKFDSDERDPLRRRYAARFGAATEPFLAPLFVMLRRVADSMPENELNAAELRERIGYFTEEVAPGKSP